MVDFPSIFTRETTFVTSSLVSPTKRLGGKFFHFRVGSFSEKKRAQTMLTELSPLKVHQFPLIAAISTCLGSLSVVSAL